MGPTGPTGDTGNTGATGATGSGGGPCARRTRTVFQLIGDGTFDTITFDSFDFDTGSLIVGASKLQAPVGGAGIYQITGQAAVVNTAVGNTTATSLILRLNGTLDIAISRETPFGGSSALLVVTTLYKLTVGDYVELVVVQVGSGFPGSVSAISNWTPVLEMARIEPLP